MEKEVLVSVIIPVYNAEKYLEQCMDSVIGQTLKEIEIICIDDGSTDSSPEILERYRKQDSRIKVLTQVNSGAGPARNNGLSNAAGKYIAFLDADDFYMPDALEKLYAKSAGDDADICVFGHCAYSEDYDEVIRYNILPKKSRYPEKMPFSMADNYVYILNFTGNSVWDKIYKKAFLDKHGLCFPGLKRSHDLYFNHLALCLAERITVLREPLITYRIFRENSLTATLSESPGDFIDSWLFTSEKLKELGVYPEQSFLNNTLGNMVYRLKSIRSSWSAFESVYYRLKNGDLQKLGLIPRGPGYYYVPWYEEVLNNLYKQDAQEFLLSFIFIMEIRNSKLTASKNKFKEENKQQKNEIKELEKENKRIKNSLSYRIGRMISWLPRMVKEEGKKEAPERNNGRS